MSQAPDELITWLRKQLTADMTEGGAISKFQIFHASEGSGGDVLGTADVFSGDDPTDIAQDLWEAAENDASTRADGTIQRYVVACFRGKETEISGQHSFIIQGGAKRGRHLNLGDTYPATDAGERGMAMAQVARMHEMMFKQSAYYAEAARSDVERERRARIRAEDRHMQVLELFEELQNRKQEREIQQAREVARMQRQDQIMSMVLKALPLIATKVLGGTGPGAATARDEGIHQLLASLKPEEMEGILGALTPEKAVMVAQLYESYAQQDKQEQEEKHPLLRDKVN